ncbi:nuclear transport factor 2 family protein [Aquimarina algicola]|uniref:Nuclear transport factor 2 family protein n=1 Tax=Aquimarina algicola TaxID=2589995 RepID=A0A504JAP6_9FLAO|nr:nuclear transport factor 2 family protein [Aquimarina algicola]TPN87987.1 nuclear transport factor 2 family protein [Aquimarina algicola]
MNIKHICLLLICIANTAIAQSDEDQIKKTIDTYIEGTAYNNPEMTMEAFYKDANLFLSHKDKEIWIVPIKEYASWLAKREKGKFNGRTGKVIAVDVSNDIATAKAEIMMDDKNSKFIDIFLLKKLKGKWKVISKAATRIE